LGDSIAVASNTFIASLGDQRRRVLWIPAQRGGVLQNRLHDLDRNPRRLLTAISANAIRKARPARKRLVRTWPNPILRPMR